MIYENSIKNPTNSTLRKISKHPNLFVRLTFAHHCLQNSTNPQPPQSNVPQKDQRTSHLLDGITELVYLGVSTKRLREMQQVSPRGGKTRPSLVSGPVLRVIKMDMDVEKRRRDAWTIRTGKHQVRSLCKIISTRRTFVSVAQRKKKLYNRFSIREIRRISTTKISLKYE